jgi:hypothetical protein
VLLYTVRTFLSYLGSRSDNPFAVVTKIRIFVWRRGN